jgi:hypothetical protein
MTLIQEIPATTWTCSNDGQQQPVDNFFFELNWIELNLLQNMNGS